MQVADAVLLRVPDFPKRSMPESGDNINTQLWHVAKFFAQNGSSRKLEVLFVFDRLPLKMGKSNRAIAGCSADRAVALSQDHTGRPL